MSQTETLGQRIFGVVTESRNRFEPLNAVGPTVDDAIHDVADLIPGVRSLGEELLPSRELAIHKFGFDVVL